MTMISAGRGAMMVSCALAESWARWFGREWGLRR